MRFQWVVVPVLLMSIPLSAADKKTSRSSLGDYLKRLEKPTTSKESFGSKGSLWRADGELSDLLSDNIAHRLNDIVVIQVLDETVAEATGAVATQRDYKANSGITALPGQFNTSGLDPLLDMHSKEGLTGTGQASSRSRLRSNLAGRVVAVLPGGSLVIEASKSVAMNHEKQTVTLRGIARSTDITSYNTVSSTRLSDLEIDVNGKGIISDSARRPHWLTRLLTRVLTF